MFVSSFYVNTFIVCYIKNDFIAFKNTYVAGFYVGSCFNFCFVFRVTYDLNDLIGVDFALFDLRNFFEFCHTDIEFLRSVFIVRLNFSSNADQTVHEFNTVCYSSFKFFRLRQFTGNNGISTDVMAEDMVFNASILKDRIDAFFTGRNNMLDIVNRRFFDLRSQFLAFAVYTTFCNCSCCKAGTKTLIDFKRSHFDFFIIDFIFRESFIGFFGYCQIVISFVHSDAYFRQDFAHLLQRSIINRKFLRNISIDIQNAIVFLIKGRIRNVILFVHNQISGYISQTSTSTLLTTDEINTRINIAQSNFISISTICNNIAVFVNNFHFKNVVVAIVVYKFNNVYKFAVLIKRIIHVQVDFKRHHCGVAFNQATHFLIDSSTASRFVDSNSLVAISVIIFQIALFCDIRRITGLNTKFQTGIGSKFEVFVNINTVNSHCINGTTTFIPSFLNARNDAGFMTGLRIICVTEQINAMIYGINRSRKTYGTIKCSTNDTYAIGSTEQGSIIFA